MLKLKTLLFIGLSINFFPCLDFHGVQVTAQNVGQTKDVSRTIRGKVVDSKKNPLVGVVVAVEGTNKATITDSNGFFNLEISGNAIVKLDYLGFKSIKQKMTPGDDKVIMMQEDTYSLDELVVVGYATQKKATLTGSVDAISGEDVNIGFVSNTMNTLTGKLSGVSVIQSGSEPGAFNSYINIRGLGAPLVVIDGMVSSMEIFQRMSPNEIENISVLKDASAAVYGMQASNGVLLVTTKKGANSEGKPTIDYSFNLGFSHLVNLTEPMNAYEFAVLQNDVRKYKLNPEAPMFDAEQLENIKNTQGFDVYNEILKPLSPSMNHSLSISGTAGNEFKVKYNIVGNYLREYGLYRSGDMSYERYNIRSNVSADIGYGFTANVNLAYMNDDKDNPYSDEVWKYIWMVKPVDDLGNVLTSLYADEEKTKFLKQEGSARNPLQDTMSDEVGYLRNNQTHLTGNMSLNWDVPFIKGLTAKFQYSFENLGREAKFWVKRFSQYYPVASGDLVETVVQSTTSAKHEHSSWFNDNMQFTLNYSRSFGEHSIGVLGVVEQQRYNTNPSYSAMRNFQLTSIDELFAGSNAQEDQFAGATAPSKKINRGYIGRLNYNYAGKYLVEASFRYDGTSAFAPKYQWGFFPSASLGWRISEENFIKNNPNLAFIDNIKIRASIGRLGDPGGAEFQWASGYTYPSGSYIFGNTIVSGLLSKGYTNEALTWFTSDMYNLGLDFGLWNGMLEGSIEGYRRDRSGMLATRQGTLPVTSGVTMPQENLNSDMTLGWEIQLSHRNKIGDFRYGITANFNMFRTKNKHVERAMPTNSYDNWRNNTNDRWNDISWAHVLGGQVTTLDGDRGLLNHQYTNQMALTGPGDYWHLDLNGDGWVDEQYDILPISTNNVPKMNYGLTLNMEYKGLDLTAVFNGAAKYTIFYTDYLQHPYVMEGKVGSLKMWTDRWHQDEEGNWIPGKYPRARDIWAYVPNVWGDSRTIRNGSYLRLKNLEIGYTFPKKWMNAVKVQNLRIFASGYNLLTISKVKEVDPEALGFLKYPMTMNFNFGANLTF